MENAALNPPPEWLENIVLKLIPPAAREEVAGDLCETCRSPRHYAGEALRTVPLVIASQMRRNLNVPALVLQGFLIFICFGATPAAIALPVLMLCDAYQPVARPSPRRALREAVLVAFGGLAVLQAASISPHAAWSHTAVAWLIWFQLFFVGPALLPVVCCLRTGLIMDSDRRPPLVDDAMSAEELAETYRGFAHRTRRGSRLEAGALAVAAILALVVPHAGKTIMVLSGIYMLVALCLLAEGLQPSAKGSLRALYRQELARQQHLRRFLWWLWFTPLLVILHDRLIESGIAAGRPLPMVGGILVMLLCFCVAALNREHGGRMQEQIGLLSRMREPA